MIFENMPNRIFSNELQNSTETKLNVPSLPNGLRLQSTSETKNNCQGFSGELSHQAAAAVLAAASLMLGSASGTTTTTSSTTNAPNSTQAPSIPVKEQSQVHPFSPWNFLNGAFNNNMIPPVFHPKQEDDLLNHNNPGNKSNGRTFSNPNPLLNCGLGMPPILVDPCLKGLTENFLASPPFGLQQPLFDPGSLPSPPSNQDRKDIYVLHEATGLKSFNSGWEAALFILMVEKIGIGEFLGRIEDERQKILRQPMHYDFTNSWKYFLIQLDPPIWRKDDLKNKSEQTTEANNVTTPSKAGTHSLAGTLSSSNDFINSETTPLTTSSSGPDSLQDETLRNRSQSSRLKRPSPDMIGPERESNAGENVFTKGESRSSPSRHSQFKSNSPRIEADWEEEEPALGGGGDDSCGKSSRLKSITSEIAAVPPLSTSIAALPKNKQSLLKSKTSQIKTRTMMANNNTVDKKLSDASQALLEKLHISVNRRGELIDYKEVLEWVEPDPESMVNLQTRVIEDWMHPNSLKQQDLVCATGLGASYICYLLKDPGNTNMSRRRRCEVYSVMTQLFENYDARIITDANFIEIKNARIQRRRCRRMTAGRVNKNSPEGDNGSSQAYSSRGSIDSVDAN